MNLIKLFNVPYLKENIKKSRGIILLFLILVPLFTALFTILELNSSGTVNIVETGEISLFNILGMYVIPLVLSFALFGYVFKKNSVDFVNSMPLNRKTIFVTNTIGGILLITLMQFFTALILIICDAFLPNIVIFTSMISDVFVLMWISYVFVFLVTNIAMSLSGTFLTQIALTMLILFLVPFCIDSYNDFYQSENYKFIGENIDFNNNVYEETVNYTMPYRVFHTIFSGNSDEIYSNGSIVRMVVLGVLYFGIGIYLFQKRKMEDTEESFSNVKIHIIVKALTILPMIILLNFIDPDIEFVIFAIALIGVYYFLFDFIVKRKVKLKTSILSFIAILIITEGICLGVGVIKDNLPVKEIDRADVESVSIGGYRSYSGGSWYYYRELFLEIGYYFDNPEIIDIIFESGNYVEDMYQIDNEENKMFSTKEIIVTEVDEQTIETKSVENTEKNYEETASIQVIFKLKSGRKLRANVEILEKDFDKIIEILEKDEKYVNIVKERFTHEGKLTVENILCDNETEEFIKREIKSKIEKMPIKDIYLTLKNSQDCGIYQYYYENHELIKNSFSITVTDDIFKKSVKLLNQNTAQILKMAQEEDIYTHVYVDIPEGKKDKKYTGYADFSQDEIVDFIIKNANKEFDITKEYYILRGNCGKYNTSIYFYTNDINTIDSMLFRDYYVTE